MSPVAQIALLGAAFVVTHVALSHRPLRSALVSKIGLWPFRGLYSLVATGLLGWQSVVWWNHRHAGDLLWAARGPVATHAAELVIAIGFGLLVAGFVRPPPASMSVERKRARARGMGALGRHPIFTGLSLWAVGHLVVNGWTGDIAFYLTWIAVTLVGCWHQDQRLKVERAGYVEYAREVPFLPLPRLRALRRVGLGPWIGFAVGVAIAFAVRLHHAQLFS